MCTLLCDVFRYVWMICMNVCLPLMCIVVCVGCACANIVLLFLFVVIRMFVVFCCV